MRNAETVLEVIQQRGSQGKPLEDIYRQLFNPALYLRAYGRLYANDGAMTPGITSETVDDTGRLHQNWFVTIFITDKGKSAAHS